MLNVAFEGLKLKYVRRIRLFVCLFVDYLLTAGAAYLLAFISTACN